jgi:hypothetical protein
VASRLVYNHGVQFIRALRERIKRGEITCSVRIWTRPHVKVGGRYRLDEGWVCVDGLLPITLGDVTPEMARRSGFGDVEELLETAKHGHGDSVFLVEFHYEGQKHVRPVATAPQSARRTRGR